MSNTYTFDIGLLAGSCGGEAFESLLRSRLLVDARAVAVGFQICDC